MSKGFVLIPVNENAPMQILPSTPETAYNVLSNAVGGDIEPVTLWTGATMYVNEEGKLNGMIPNRRAQKLWDRVYGHTDIIVGPAVLTGGIDQAGDDRPLSEGQFNILCAYVEG